MKKFNSLGFKWQDKPTNFYHVYHQLVGLIDNRDDVIKNLEKEGYKCLIHYPIPPYKSKAYKGLFNDNKYPKADEIANKILSLPIHGYIWNK